MSFERKYSFAEWTKEEISSAFDFSEGYKKFLTDCKTERECVRWVEKQAESHGYEPLETIDSLKAKGKKLTGKKFYKTNRGKSMVMARLGKRPVRQGVAMILAHVDSPRLDLKVRPLYEKERLCFLKTHYYGGIKKYQWPCLPLAMHGVLAKEDGKKVEIEIGEKKDDPVLIISDLLPHLAKAQMQKKLSEAIQAEELNLLVGSIPKKGKDIKEGVKSSILEMLNRKYGIIEEDFVSADLEIVPAGPARDAGFDSSLISAYGQDDRSCVYASLEALFASRQPEFSSVVVLVDREEIGSEGPTGALSSFIVDFISELIYLQEGKHDENHLRDALSLSRALSADTMAGFDPDYADVYDPHNSPRIGAGIAVEKYTGLGGKYHTNEATAEYMAYIRGVFNKNDIEWQPGGLNKVDVGGGGTIAKFLARHNVDVVDCGPPLLSLHAPFEISSKADIYSCYKAYKAFLSAK